MRRGSPTRPPLCRDLDLPQFAERAGPRVWRVWRGGTSATTRRPEVRHPWGRMEETCAEALPLVRHFAAIWICLSSPSGPGRVCGGSGEGELRPQLDGLRCGIL